MENKCAEYVREDWSGRSTDADDFSCGDGEFISMIINTIECHRANNHHCMFDFFVQHNSRAASHDPPASTSANPADGSQTPQP